MTDIAEALEFAVIEQAVDRLRGLVDANGAKVFAEVLGVVDAAGVDKPPRTPSAVIAPIAERADEAVAPRVERSPQRYLVTIGIVHTVQAANDRKGDRARDRLKRILAHSRGALAGWKPEGQREVLSYRRGRLVDIDGGRVSWADEYELGHWARQGGVVRA